MPLSRIKRGRKITRADFKVDLRFNRFVELSVWGISQISN
jgi:hypothetical protein